MTSIQQEHSERESASAPKSRLEGVQHRASLRSAINAKCRDCICDPLDAGTAAQQIACCTDSTCSLHPVRPVTATLIPLRLLRAYHVDIEDLDARARGLVRVDDIATESGRNGPVAAVSFPVKWTVHN